MHGSTLEKHLKRRERSLGFPPPRPKGGRRWEPTGDAARGTSEDARHLASDVGRPVVSRIGGRVEVPARRREGFTSPKAPQDPAIVGDPRAGHRLKLRRRLRRGFRCTPPIGGVRFVGCHGVRGSREAPRLQPALRCAPPRPDRERLLRPGRRPERGASPHPRAPAPIKRR